MVKMPKWLTTSLIAVLVGVSALAMLPEGCSAEVSWSSYATPDHLYVGQDETMTFYIHNSGAMDLDIWNYFVYFDWEYYVIKHTIVNSTRVTVAAGTDSIHYTLPIRVSAWAGQHDAKIYCVGQVNGDPRTWDGSWIYSFTMDAVPLLTISSISANPGQGAAPLSVSFGATPSGGLPPYSYSWAFGDGGNSTSATPSHMYVEAGNYTAVVTVTDTEYADQVITARATITVIWQALSVTGTVSTSLESLSVVLSCTPRGGNGNYNYSWDFGDHSDISFEQNPTHQYSAAGTYIVTVTLRDIGGNESRWSDTVTVPQTSPPSAELPKREALSLDFIVGSVIVVAGVICIASLYIIRRRMD